MKRNLVLLLTMTAAAFAQTPTVVEKPAVKASTATAKVAPQTAARNTAKPSPTVKVNAAAQKPAVVSVQPVVAKVATPTPKAAATAHASVASSAKPVTVVATPSKPAAVTASKPNPLAPKTSEKPTVSAKPAVAAAKVAGVPAKTSAAKASPMSAKAHEGQTSAKGTRKSHTAVAVQDRKATPENKKPEPKSINASGRRDPFVSPVVSMSAAGSGCSSGKRCLAIDQVALKGVVKSDVGMIAVVVNAMDKAYFLRENDPVFNGYVLKITGDSIVFKETFHDRLGKALTRDVTKTIRRPAV
jgi:Tfp pilus assembly protein PilP